MKKYRYEIILFIVDAVSMILELVASRLLSPYFGNSNIVWTSVIGIILFSSSIGNYFGGKIADKNNKEKMLRLILSLASILILIIPITQNYILNQIYASISNMKIGAIISTIILFLLPTTCIGMVTPIILKLKLENYDTAGSTAGKLNAIATIGGIFGTFLGGFLLVPILGSSTILFILSAIIAILILLVKNNCKSKSNYIICIIFTICMILFSVMNVISNKSNKKRVLQGELNTIVDYDTQYGRVKIYNVKNDRKENIRILNIDSGFESATYIDEGRVNDLVFDYTKFYDLMFDANIDIKDTLLIGGAGYSYPKYYISHYKDKNMDVVEIDGKITEIAKEYFFLDQLIKDYNLNNQKRLNLITEDGRVYLNSNVKKYDAILNDAFSGENPAKTLTTLENIENIKKSLNYGGVYLTNIISSLDGKNSKFLKAEVNTLKCKFKNVYVVPCDNSNDLDSVQNNMVIATDDDLKIDGLFDLKIESNEIILTDDFCPVDTLTPNS